MAYNGWNNYETWNVALWIDNEQGSYQLARDMAQEAWDETKDEKEHKDMAESRLARRLESWIEEQKPDLGATMWADLLNAALSEVDWYEIAHHYLSDVETKVEA